MKRMKNIFLAAVGLLLVSCAEPELIAPQNPESEQLGEPITITVGMPSNDTKISVSDPGGMEPLNLTWEANDQLVVVGFDESGNTCLGTSDFTLSSGIGEKNATFTGKTIPDAVKYKVYYKTPNLTLDNQGQGIMSYQNMVSDSHLSSIRPFLFLNSDIVNYSQGLSFALKLENSVLCVTLPSTTEISNVTSIDWIANAGFDRSAQIESHPEKVLSLGLKGSGLKYYFCFNPDEMAVFANEKMLFRLHGTSENKFLSTTLGSNLSYEKGKLYEANFTDQKLQIDPVADILDIQFDSNNNAINLAKGDLAVGVQTFPGDKLSFYNDVTYNRCVAQFSHNVTAAPKSGAFTFKETRELRENLSNGFTIEAYLMCHQSPEGKESKAFSSTSSGGLALMIDKQNHLCFLLNDNGKYKFISSSDKVELNQWYHVVGVWDKGTGIARCYVNGVEKEQENLGTDVKLKYSKLEYFTIGANSNSGSFDKPEFNAPWNGDIAIARMYSEPLTAEQVFSVYQQIKPIQSTLSESTDENTPVADLLDIQFNNDGLAHDVSAGRMPIIREGKPSCMNGVATFNNTIGGFADHYYRINYDQNYFNNLADGHSMELIFSAGNSLTNLPADKEAKMFASHGSGGTGFLITKANAGNEKKEHVLAFLPHVGGKYCYAKSNVTAAELSEGGYYHVVGVWNKTEGKAYIYVNGKKIGTGVEAIGDLTLPTYQWFGIGADAGAAAETPWNGNVAVARIYDDPLTADQVKALYNKAETQKLVNPQK